jgi:hypothetical protein
MIDEPKFDENARARTALALTEKELFPANATGRAPTNRCAKFIGV